MLVIWQLETRVKQFLPRLGSAINAITISKDQMLYALLQNDNCIRILSATDLTTKTSIVGMKSAKLDHRWYPMSIGLQLQPMTKNLVMNGTPGSLQVYDSETDTFREDVTNNLN